MPRTPISQHPRLNLLGAFPIARAQTPRLPPSHVSQRGPPSRQNENPRSGPHRKTLNLVAIQVIQTNVGSRIFHTTSVFLIRDMGVDSISGNTKLASGQGNVPVTVAQCLADFDTS